MQYICLLLQLVCRSTLESSSPSLLPTMCKDDEQQLCGVCTVLCKESNRMARWYEGENEGEGMLNMSEVGLKTVLLPLVLLGLKLLKFVELL